MWEIEKIFNFRDNKNFGFHDYFGHRYVLDFDNSWIGKEKENTFEWTAGHKPDIEICHVNAEIEEPTYLTGLPNGSLLVVSSGNKKIYKILLEENKIKEIDVFIDCAKIGLKDVGNKLKSYTRVIGSFAGRPSIIAPTDRHSVPKAVTSCG